MPLAQPNGDVSWSNRFKHFYGDECYSWYRAYQHLAIQHTKLLCDELFLRTCIKDKLVPHFCKINLSPKNQSTANLIRNFQNKLLKSELQTKKNAEYACANKLKIYWYNMKSVVSHDDLQTIFYFVNKDVVRHRRIKSEVHHKKLNHLRIEIDQINLQNPLDPYGDSKEFAKLLGPLQHKVSSEPYHINGIKIDKGVVNLSDRMLSDKEHDLLARGMTYAPPPKLNARTMLEFQVAQEDLARRVLISAQKPNTFQNPAPINSEDHIVHDSSNNTTVHPTLPPLPRRVETTVGRFPNRCTTTFVHNAISSVKNKIESTYSQCNAPQNYIRNDEIFQRAQEENLIISDLVKTPTIRITSSDKGGVVVVMNNSDYNEKLNDLLNSPNYVKLNSNPISDYNGKLNDILLDLRKRKVISDSEYRYIRVTNPRTARFKGNPKIHKPNQPLRPITDSFDSFNYYLAKFLARIFRKYSCNVESNLNNSFEMKEKLINLDPEFSDCIMASIDVVALFTSVPTDEAIAYAVDL